MYVQCDYGNYIYIVTNNALAIDSGWQMIWILKLLNTHSITCTNINHIYRLHFFKNININLILERLITDASTHLSHDIEAVETKQNGKKLKNISMVKYLCTEYAENSQKRSKIPRNVKQHSLKIISKQYSRTKRHEQWTLSNNALWKNKNFFHDNICG